MFSQHSSYDSPKSIRISDIFSIARTPESELYQEQREILKEHVNKLNRSFESKEKILKSFEDLLRAVHFFDKPDIIPTPNDIDRIKQQILQNQEEPNQESYRKLYEDEKKLRGNKENEWKEKEKKWRYLEKECEELKNKAVKIREIENENEQLRKRLKRFAEIERENEELRKELKTGKKKKNNAKASELERFNQQLKRECEERDIIIAELKEEIETLRRTLKEYRDKYETSCEALKSHSSGEKERYLAEELYEVKNRLKTLQDEHEFTLRKLEETKPLTSERLPTYVVQLEERNIDLEDRVKILEKAYSNQLDYTHRIEEEFKRKGGELDKVDERNAREASLKRPKPHSELNGNPRINNEIRVEENLSEPKPEAEERIPLLSQPKLINPFQDKKQASKLYSSESLSIDDQNIRTPSSEQQFLEKIKDSNKAPANYFSIKEQNETTIDPSKKIQPASPLPKSKKRKVGVSTTKSHNKAFKNKSSTSNIHTEPSEPSSRRKIGSSLNESASTPSLKKASRKSSKESVERLTGERGEFCDVCVRIHGHKWAHSPYKEKPSI
ncbi:unnamed protein product [Blepharisma stoltei]|uniref:Uncharacterized protein n=1 Tax=Blepharisma stoltei TaxID=1481888 RepID=A0AAU9JSX9_9CILI|nr:unnamed protein product [Blepharisma stoltei]